MEDQPREPVAAPHGIDRRQRRQASAVTIFPEELLGILAELPVSRHMVMDERCAVVGRVGFAEDLQVVPLVVEAPNNAALRKNVKFRRLLGWASSDSPIAGMDSR